MRFTDHYPVHWGLSSFKSHSNIEYKVKRTDWVVLNCILQLKQNFFFTLSEQMRHQSIDFILVYEAFLVALQGGCTTYHKTRSYRRTLPPYLVNIIKQRRRILCLYRSSLYSLNKYIHHELRATKRAQCQESCLGLEPKNTQRFWNHSKKLFKERATSIRGFLDEQDNRVITETDGMIEHARQYYSETFREKETASRNQEMAEFKNHLTEKPVELHSPNIQ
jgi:hypothetical protein